DRKRPVNIAWEAVYRSLTVVALTGLEFTTHIQSRQVPRIRRRSPRPAMADDRIDPGRSAHVGIRLARGSRGCGEIEQAESLASARRSQHHSALVIPQIEPVAIANVKPPGRGRIEREAPAIGDRSLPAARLPLRLSVVDFQRR